MLDLNEENGLRIPGLGIEQIFLRNGKVGHKINKS